MKLVLFLMVILLFSVNSAINFDSSVNYVSNPYFSIPKLASGQHSELTSAGAWSEVNNKIEIGDGKLYNSRWTYGQVVDLIGQINSNIYQSINLDAGYYQLNITWAANTLTKNLASSKFSVYLNDALIQFFTPVDYEIHKQTLVVNAIQGANKLSLRGEGILTSGDVGAGVKFVGLYGQKKNIQFDNSVNYVSNPDFSIPKLASGQSSVFTSAGAWSEVNNKIEIGDVKIYNSRWTSGQIVDLIALINSNIYQSINLDAGYYQLNITWAAGQRNNNFDSSKFSVYWNDAFVQFFAAIDFEIHKQTLVVKAIQGANKLSLISESTNDNVGAGVKLVQLYAQNNIQNGNFQIPSTRKGWRIHKSASPWSSYTDEIKIGQGTIFNSVWKTGQVAELDANQNSQIYQIVSIPAGQYHLKFDWAARTGAALISNSFSVLWNSVRIAFITSPDYLVHTFMIDVRASQGNNILSLKGEGISDGYGVGIDNIRLWRAV